MAQLLWKPSKERRNSSNMLQFMNLVNEKYNRNFDKYDLLYKWSVENISDFWACMWEFADLKSSSKYDQVVDDLSKMPGARWFKGARLNFAENLLKFNDKKTAIIYKTEDKDTVYISYAKLYREVARIAKSLKEEGIKPGDRVACFMPNMPETVFAMLAATSIGAIFSSCSPDFGIKGVFDRFGQIKPKVLFTADGYYFKGKAIDSLERISDIMLKIPSIQKLIVLPNINKDPDIRKIPGAVLYNDFISSQLDLKIEFEQLCFDHPVYIMYSSGTTGMPKCMVQSAGGILINHLKELILHTDLKREDKIFYFTTCGWMMWNWLVSSLAVGSTIVLYDGNPFFPDSKILWKMAQDEKITIFGTSAGYITALQNQGAKPDKEFDLTCLKTILSTGSPLSVEGFKYIYENVKKDVQLSSISGGSDLNGCFALGNPLAPVYAGVLQCRGLAMKVESFDESGEKILSRQGELVCTAPFPSMPIYFWDDPDGKKYHKAYFDVYPNIWRHGDFIEINKNGGIIIFGRSDATLNPGGVRIGTSEIYRQVEKFEEIKDCVAVGQIWKNDVRVILFVVMNNGYRLNDALINQIKKILKNNASPRHVPAKIISVPDIPYTLNMKKVELAVKNIIHNQPVSNQDSLSNPESLRYFKNLDKLIKD